MGLNPTRMNLILRKIIKDSAYKRLNTLIKLSFPFPVNFQFRRALSKWINSKPRTFMRQSTLSWSARNNLTPGKTPSKSNPLNFQSTTISDTFHPKSTSIKRSFLFTRQFYRVLFSLSLHLVSFYCSTVTSRNETVQIIYGSPSSPHRTI